MKKNFVMLLVGLFILLPITVKAATSITIKPNKACLTDDDFCTITASVLLTTDEFISEAIDATVTLAPGVEIDSVEDSDHFTLTKEGNVVKFTPKEDVFKGDGKEVLMGKVVFKYSQTIEDCSVNFSFPKFNTTKEVTITAGTTVQTGSSFPYVIAAIGLTVGIGLFSIKRKTTKIHSV